MRNKKKSNTNGLITKCEKILDNAYPTLSKHRGYKKIIGNIVLGILGLGIIYSAIGLIKKAITGKFLFFNDSKSARALNKIKKSINALQANNGDKTSPSAKLRQP